MVMISGRRDDTGALATSSASNQEQPRAEILSVAVRRQLPGFLLDIAFNVPRGLTVFFGPSGAGKSLTLQTLAGLSPADEARIVFGEYVWYDSAQRVFVPPQKRLVGYVPQNYALFPHLTVEQNIAFGITASRAEKRQRVAELVSLVRLEGLERQHPGQISGGQQQRVALARALAVRPQLLLLDEPFSSLDVPVREALREELRALQKQVGIPIILVTHDALEASVLADTMVVISAGRVLQVGPQESIFRSPRTSAAAQLVGMHTCWQGEVTALDMGIDHTTFAGQLLASIQVAGFQVYACAPQASALARGQSVEIGLRADEVRLYPGDMLDEQARQSALPSAFIPGMIVRAQPQGIMHKVTVRLAGEHQIDIPMMSREYREQGFTVSAPVTVQIPTGAVHIFALPDRPLSEA